MIELRKNVPMPLPRKSYSDFPIDQMDVGDSFIVPPSYGHRQKVSGILNGWRLANDRTARFRTVTTPDGTGVWRTA